MALASGGQVIQVSKGQLPQATDIILDTSTSALVGLFFFIIIIFHISLVNVLASWHFMNQYKKWKLMLTLIFR